LRKSKWEKYKFGIGDKPEVIAASFSLPAALESLEFFERARPVDRNSRDNRDPQNFSTRLASSTIVRFVVRVANPLNLFSTPQQGCP